MIFNVDTSNNTLKALSNKAFAKGVLTQSTGENNFSSVKNLVSSWKLENNLTKVENDKVIVNAFINPNDIIILYYNNILSVVPYGKSTLGPLLRSAMKKGKITGELYTGEWLDIGTPQRLEKLNSRYKVLK